MHRQTVSTFLTAPGVFMTSSRRRFIVIVGVPVSLILALSFIRFRLTAIYVTVRRGGVEGEALHTTLCRGLRPPRPPPQSGEQRTSGTNHV
jgi:hypothetical protein